MRYQQSVNVIQEEHSDSGSVASVEEHLSENEINSDRTNEVSEAGYELSGEHSENEEISTKFQAKSVEENVFENDIIDRVIENNILNLSESLETNEETNIDRHEDNNSITPKPRPRRRVCTNPFENFKPRRSGFVGRVNSSHYERLMKLVGQERVKHREMINSVNNTTFALSRRPLPTYKNYNLPQRRRHVKPSPPLAKDRKKSSKSVRFGTLVTFEDGGTPVPIRPARRRPSQRSTSTSGKLMDLTGPREDFVPEKPRRVYAGRRVTACTLSEALQSRQDHPGESALEKIKRLIKTVEQKSDSREDPSKKRTVLSALNLFLSLAYERLRNPTVLCGKVQTKPSLLMSLTDCHCADDVSWLTGNIDPQGSNRIPTAVEQLRGRQNGSVHLGNIPTLLLFNLIFGRSL